MTQYKIQLPDPHTLIRKLGGKIVGGTNFRLPHLCGGETEITHNPGLSVWKGATGETMVNCHYGHSWEEAVEAVRTFLGGEYMEMREISGKVPTIGGIEAIRTIVKRCCPSCGNDGFTIFALCSTDDPYLGLKCAKCRGTYDELHSRIARRCKDLGKNWVQAVPYRLKDGEDRFHVRVDGVDPSNYWGQGKGRRVSDREPHRWTDGKVAILVEGAKAAVALVSALSDGDYSIFSAGDTSGLKSGNFKMLVNEFDKLILWPDRDAKGEGISRPGESAMAEMAKRVMGSIDDLRIVDVKGMDDGADAADFSKSEILEYLKTALPYSADSESETIFEVHDTTDIAANLRFLERYADNILAVRDQEGKWRLLWDHGNSCWREDAGRIQNSLAKTNHEWGEWTKAALLAAGSPKGRIREIEQLMKRYSKPRGFNSAIGILPGSIERMREEERLPEQITICNEDDLDSNARYLGAPNGVIDLQTAKIIPRKEAKQKLITRMILDPFIPGASHPDVTKLFGHIPDQERQWLLGSIGFALWGDPSRTLYLILGGGGEGKSTLLSSVNVSLGDYAGEISSGTLEQKRGGGSAGLSPELEPFVTCRLVIDNELKSRTSLDQDLLKKLSGGDLVKYRRLYQNFETSRHATATMFLAINQLPRLDLSDKALLQRIRVLRYPMPEKIDTGLRHRLVEDQECRQALVALLCTYAAKGRTQPANTPSIEEEIKEARRVSLGEAGEWIEKTIIKTGGDHVLFSKDVWEAACKTLDLDPANTDRVFGRTRISLTRTIMSLLELSHTRLLRDGKRTGNGWRGVKLASDHEQGDFNEAAEPF